MEILYLLIPIALVIVLIIGMALFWAIRSGQYEDMEGPAHSILMDDDDPMIPGNNDVENATPDQRDEGVDRTGNGKS